MALRPSRPLYATAWLLPWFVALLALQGCVGPDLASQYLEDPEALARGEAVFVGTCSGYCHIPGIAVGDVPDLFDCAWRHGGSSQDIFSVIANGWPGSRMVAFGGRLPDGDEDIWKIVAYLKSETSDC